MSKSKTDQALALRERGLSYAQIGLRLGLTTSHVNYLLYTARRSTNSCSGSASAPFSLVARFDAPGGELRILHYCDAFDGDAADFMRSQSKHRLIAIEARCRVNSKWQPMSTPKTWAEVRA